MPKLYFRYGAMGSGKTVNLLVALFEYHSAKKNAFLIKPRVDVRHGTQTVWSRVPGLTTEADIVLGYHDQLSTQQLDQLGQADCVFVDEIQFFHPKQVEQLSWLSLSVPVICYGLRTDYRGRLFPGSAAMFAWADCIREIKNVCRFCPQKATHNFKRVNTGAFPDQEAGVALGADEMYIGVCKACFYQKRSAEDVRLVEYKVHTHDPVMIEPEPASDL
jgi:thymidine kinase